MAKSFDVMEFMKEAKELGLSPEEIGKILRDERAAERENQKQMLELQEAEKQRQEAEKQRQEAERLRAHEIVLADKQYAEAEAKRQQQLALAQLGAGQGSSSSTIRAEKPRIPAFDEGQDDMDSYLLRFERLATAYGWEEKDFGLYLGTLLRGKALKVYTNLPKDVADDFDSLKNALLKAYAIDADTYRKKFRSAKVKDDENYTQLVVRLEQYLERWLTLAKVEKKYDSLCDFIVKDQILSNCPHDLRIFLKERDFDTSVKLAEAADRFRGAHMGDKKFKKAPRQTVTKGKSEGEKISVSSNVICHECGESGHIRPKCPKNPRNFKQSSSQSHKVQFVFEADRKP